MTKLIFFSLALISLNLISTIAFATPKNCEWVGGINGTDNRGQTITIDTDGQTLLLNHSPYAGTYSRDARQDFRGRATNSNRVFLGFVQTGSNGATVAGVEQTLLAPTGRGLVRITSRVNGYVQDRYVCQP